MVQPVRAQTPSDSVPATPAIPQSAAAQIDSLLSAVVEQISQKKWTEAAQSAKQAVALSQSIGDLAQQLRATNLLALACFRSGQTGEAIQPFRRSRVNRRPDE